MCKNQFVVSSSRGTEQGVKRSSWNCHWRFPICPYTKYEQFWANLTRSANSEFDDSEPLTIFKHRMQCWQFWACTVRYPDPPQGTPGTVFSCRILIKKFYDKNSKISTRKYRTWIVPCTESVDLDLSIDDLNIFFRSDVFRMWCWSHCWEGGTSALCALVSWNSYTF